LLFVPHVSAAQDPVTTLSDSYRVQFENAQVRVVRVHYPAGAKLPDHTHPTRAPLYVYLNDSDGIVFHHSGGMSHVVNRPAVKAGSMRLSTGSEEHHTAENTSAATDPLASSVWIAMPSGETRWVGAAAADTIVNSGPTPMELLRVIFR
jgi:hypothetical protein